MSSTNENILKSLAVLEKNLNEINSAKEEVSKVVSSSVEIVKVLDLYQSSFEGLSLNVKSVIDDFRKFNLDSIAKLSEQTQSFSKEITKLTEFDVSNSLKSIESKVVKQFEQNLIKPLNALDEQTKKIEIEVVRLTEFDFSHSVKNIETEVVSQFKQNLVLPLVDLEEHTKKIKEEVAKLTEFDFQNSFNQIEKEVVNQFNINLKEQLLTVDNKAKELQSKIDEFKNQILRIEKIDLVSHFNELLTALNHQADKQRIELRERFEAVKSQSSDIISRFDKQDIEIKSLRTQIFVSIGIFIIGAVLNIVLK